MKYRKLLVICGPTAVGKTSLAVYLAKKFQGEVVSADSRQVYVGMDIGTGKDLPENSKFQFPVSDLKREGIGCYKIGGVRVWGYDLVSPKKGFNVAEYVKNAKRIVKNIWKRGKLPILVGGSGLYIKGLVDGIQTSHIPQDIKLRILLENKNIEELFEMLTKVDPVRSASMNVSDRKNSRRLVRAIEVAMWKAKNRDVEQEINLGGSSDVLFVGLSLERDKINERIERRVDIRAEQGVKYEVERLISQGVGWEMQAMNALGYKEWRQYFEKKMSEHDVVERWKTNEKNYMKRQMTWFKRDNRIHWFDIGRKNLKKRVENLIQQWYSSSRESYAKKD